MKKRVLSVFLVLCLIFTLLPVTASAASTEMMQIGTEMRKSWSSQTRSTMFLLNIENAFHLHCSYKQNADKRAENHNTFKRKVDYTASLGEHARKGNDEKRNCEYHSLLYQKYHYLSSPFALSETAVFAVFLSCDFFILFSSAVLMKSENALI